MNYNLECVEKSHASRLEAFREMFKMFPSINTSGSGSGPFIFTFDTWQPGWGQQVTAEVKEAAIPKATWVELTHPSMSDAWTRRPDFSRPEDCRGQFEMAVRLSFPFKTFEMGDEERTGSLSMRLVVGRWSLVQWLNGGADECKRLVGLLPDDPSPSYLETGSGHIGKRKWGSDMLDSANREVARWREAIASERKRLEAMIAAEKEVQP